MDQGVIECFKRKYCWMLLSEILGKMDGDSSTRLIQTLKTTKIKDVIYMVSRPYDEIQSSTFTKFWRKVWPDVEDIIEMSKGRNQRAGEPILHFSESDDNQSMLNYLLLLSNSIDLVENDVEYCSYNDEKLGNEILNNDDIVEAVTTQEKESEEEDKVNKEGKRLGNFKREWLHYSVQ
ncbi:hypothetical protein J6590_028784 [Homalodisca vitripennis]|nr:hypothetical protein J6590_028784 [Homalodisca vitripennis]